MNKEIEVVTLYVGLQEGIPTIDIEWRETIDSSLQKVLHNMQLLRITDEMHNEWETGLILKNGKIIQLWNFKGYNTDNISRLYDYFIYNTELEELKQV